MSSRETVLEALGDDGVLVLTMNRPRQKNAFNNRMWLDMRDALRDALANDAVRCVVVTGAGGAFTAGQDLGEMGGRSAPAGEEPGFGPFMDVLSSFDKPLVAAVNGVGIGIGLTMLLHCDYVYVARDARLRAPFVTLGVLPEAASSYLLPALIGTRAAIDVFFESDFMDGARATELGIATECCAPEAVLDAALARARKLAKKPLGSLRWTKRVVLAARADQVAAARAREDQGFRHRVGSPENVEAITAFFEKREPDFTRVSPADKSG
jgi:enoyl-CoA hydratase/carnithine racemase